MRKIDFSKSLKYLGDDIISEAEALRNTKSPQRKPQLSKHIAIAACAALIISAALFIGTNSELNHTHRPPDTSQPTITKNTISSEDLPSPPTVTDEPPITSSGDTGENTAPTEPDKTNELPNIGGSDSTFARKFISKAENIYIIDLIVGEEVCTAWADDFYRWENYNVWKEVPALYQIIHDLNIPKEDFIAQNEEFIEYPDMYYSEEIISALYTDDVEEMKKQLVNPLALYYDGEIYTFDELCRTPELAENIPADTISSYLDFIYDLCVEEKLIKYMQEDFDKVRSCIK